MDATRENIVILGGGIIGFSTAYYLSQLAPATTNIRVLDPSAILFTSASGKAAGFLARDWFASKTSSLGALSFDLHRALATEHDGANKWAWSTSIAYSLSDLAPKEGASRGEDWLFEGTSRALMAPDQAKGVLPEWLAQGTPKISEVISTHGPPAKCTFSPQLS